MWYNKFHYGSRLIHGDLDSQYDFIRRWKSTKGRDRQTDRLIERIRETGKERGRVTDRQTDRQTETETEKRKDIKTYIVYILFSTLRIYRSKLVLTNINVVIIFSNARILGYLENIKLLAGMPMDVMKRPFYPFSYYIRHFRQTLKPQSLPNISKKWTQTFLASNRGRGFYLNPMIFLFF